MVFGKEGRLMQPSENGFYASFWYGILLAIIAILAIGPFIILFPKPMTFSTEAVETTQVLLVMALSVFLLSLAYSRPLFARRAILKLISIMLGITITTFLIIKLLAEFSIQMPLLVALKMLFIFDGEAAYDANFYENILTIWVAVAAVGAAFYRLGCWLRAHRKMTDGL